VIERGEQDDITLLFGRYKAGLAAMSHILDVEAGLIEVLLQSRHDAAQDGLATLIDIEAGLAAIIPTGKPMASIGGNRGNRVGESQQALLERYLESVDPSRRIALRAKSRVLTAWNCYVLACRTRSALKETRRSVATLAEDLADVIRLDPTGHHAFARTRDHPAVQGMANIARCVAALTLSVLDRGCEYLPEEIPGHLDRVTDAVTDATKCSQRLTDAAAWTETSSLPELWSTADSANLMHALRAATRSAGRLVRMSLAEVRHEIGVCLGQYPLELHGCSLRALFDDFTASDLRDVDLSGVDLAGVCWSEDGTRWPPSINPDELKNRSRETERAGTYVVQASTTTFADVASCS